MSTIYCLGGSACCGKSTMAQILAEKHNLQYYGFDDRLWENVARGADNGSKWLQKVQSMTMDEMWLSRPEEMYKNAIKTCVELYPYVAEDLKALPDGKDIIAEGAVFLPSLVEEFGINKNHYICMIPTENFQLVGYSKRLWISDYLSKTSDKETAYRNWMKRDILYAKDVAAVASYLGLKVFVADGTKSIDGTVALIEEEFGIKEEQACLST